jgi:hypothetical protein
MFTRIFTVMVITMLLVSACAPAAETNSNQAVRDELQPILKAVVSGSDEDRLALFQFVNVPCANMEGLGGPPPCPESVAEGTDMQVFPILGSEGSLLSLEEVTNMMSDLQVKDLYAVYRETPNPNAEPYYQTGEYAMLFERETSDLQLPVVFQVRDGRIVRIDYHIGVSPEDILKEIPIEQVVIAPQEAKAWTEALR